MRELEEEGEEEVALFGEVLSEEVELAEDVLEVGELVEGEWVEAEVEQFSAVMAGVVLDVVPGFWLVVEEASDGL